MIISFSPFFSTISRLAADRLSLFPCHHRSYIQPSMFTYDGIRSQLEWNSTLSPAKAIHPTADTKFLRKVRRHPSSAGQVKAHTTFRPPLSRQLVRTHARWSDHDPHVIVGPNTNSVEKLTALRRAGVNVGQSPSVLRLCHRSHRNAPQFA